MSTPHKPIAKPTEGELVTYDGTFWQKPLFKVTDSSDNRPYRQLSPGTVLTAPSGQRHIVAQNGLVLLGSDNAGDVILWNRG